MKRITLWALSTLTTVVLLFGYHTSTSGPLPTSETTSIQTGAYSVSPSTGSGSSTTTSNAQTIAGDVAETQWGPVQVQITTAGSDITDVTVLQYPNGNGRDEEINSYALPILTEETIDAQSAQIDMVSGATVTSEGYLQSLQSALDQAGL